MLIGFFDQNMLQHFDFERFLSDPMIHRTGKRSGDKGAPGR
jgi:hypothetical protein